MDKVDNLVEIYQGGDYGSEFEYDSEAEHKRNRRKDLAQKEKGAKTKMPSKEEVTSEYNKEEGRKMRFQVISLDAYSRHRKYINDYLFYYGGSKQEFQRDSSRDKRDIDVVRENHRFLWTDDDESEETWEKRLSKKYYDKLFKEYCITDLSRYKENKIALRWRIEKEVVEGKGQFVCGNKKCTNNEQLRSWEVNFGYVEHGEKKNALVKLRLCPECSKKLNYHHRRKEVKKRHHADTSEESSKRHKDSHKEDKSETTETTDKGRSQVSPSGSDKQASSSEKDDKGTPEGGIWTGPLKITEEKSKEEEYEEYFEDMFL